jgi:hypothetical protein
MLAVCVGEVDLDEVMLKLGVFDRVALALLVLDGVRVCVADALLDLELEALVVTEGDFVGVGYAEHNWPRVEFMPTRHAAHTVFEDSVQFALTSVPAAQTVQAEHADAPAKEYLPVLQGLHAEAPDDENVPGKHDEHVLLELAPTVVENVPAMHKVHAAAPLDEYVPAAQAVHDVEYRSEYVPALHPRQCVDV